MMVWDMTDQCLDASIPAKEGGTRRDDQDVIMLSSTRARGRWSDGALLLPPYISVRALLEGVRGTYCSELGVPSERHQSILIGLYCTL